MAMLRVRWFPDPGVSLGAEIRAAVEGQIRGIEPARLNALREYEETGDAIPLLEDPYEGLAVKVVRHRGRLLVAATLWEHGGFIEEYYVAELADRAQRDGEPRRQLA